ncbi:hypothetical protein HRG84_17405 [Flavisolibacter sp. BT320]|nr:hypothetical protein [Flavisolibacter longurius]
MIDPKDVRPGNWVIKMTGMDVNHLPFFAYKAVALDEYLFSFSMVCFPVPLTTGIFGKCGFKHDYGDWYMNMPAEDIDDGLPFLRYRRKEKSWYLRDVKIPAQPLYLHQLQNLFHALTQKELNVQLGFFENTENVGPINFFDKPLQTSVAKKPLL